MSNAINICKASAGTGKTFTLAAYYVGLLLRGVSYRNILAVTFTNKATAEMRVRILGYLYAIANGAQEVVPFVEKALGKRIDAIGEDIRHRAAECFEQMLLDYDNVQVQTIDSFLLTLLTGMAGVLRMSTGLSTELDIDYVIGRAVDKLLTGAMTPEVEKLLKQYLNVQLDNERTWDVRKAVKDMAVRLYQERVQMLETDGKIVFDAATIARYRTHLQQVWKNLEERKPLEQLLAQAAPLIDMDQPHGRDLSRAYERLHESLTAPDKMKTEELFCGLTDKQMADAPQWNKQPAAMMMVEATRLGKQLREPYLTIKLSTGFSYEMQLMSALRALIAETLAEQNSALLAQTASILHEALKAGDADFILEKAGIRYHHILIDEFQDTSRLQWQVFKPLLEELMASGGNSVLIVGDIKQSIYRWRNGDWSIMAGLEGKEEQLVRNFRSRRVVVEQNLRLFDHVVAHAPEEQQTIFQSIYGEGYDGQNIQNYYRPGREGGFVQMRGYVTGKGDEHAAERVVLGMFDTMEELLKKGALPSHMMVLVRGHKEAQLITDMHATLAEESYPLLRRAAIVEAASYQLQAARSVQAVVNGIRYMHTKDRLAAQMVVQLTRRLDAIEGLEQINPQLPLYELVSEVIRLLLCDNEGRYQEGEVAYVNCLLDSIRSYVTQYGSDTEEWLRYWDEQMCKQAIPAPTGEAIRIMTIHTSKGLEAQTVFVPFCQWSKEVSKFGTVWCEARYAQVDGKPMGYLPIQDGKAAADSAYKEEIAEEHDKERIENLNLLYVALTRAVDNLYVSALFNRTKKDGISTSHVGDYVAKAWGLDLSSLEMGEQDEVSFGESVIAAAKQQEQGVFDFNGSPNRDVVVWSNGDRVRFVQSQECMRYIEMGEEADRRAARIDEGNLCHEIFAAMQTIDDLNGVMDDFVSRGLIQSPEQRQTIEALINNAWTNDKMTDWFTNPWTVDREQAIFMHGKEYRPDRVMTDRATGRAIVLDYKFGHEDKKYYDQVRTYMRAMELLGYEHVEGYLWYARTGELKQVK